MSVPAICPFCYKTVLLEQKDSVVCPECGQTILSSELKKQNLYIDTATEAKEFALAKDYFVNTEFLSAFEHFKKAFAANKNSYLSEYFIRLCDVYLNESANGYDVMAHVIDVVKKPLVLAARANITVNDKLTFIVAMLNETKIIILNRLKSQEQLYEENIESYRKLKIAELMTLVELFKIDGELLMTYAPEVSSALVEIADCALGICHKCVQTVVIGEDIHSPTDKQYKQLTSLNNDYSFFAVSLSDGYDVKKFVPDFTQNFLLIDKVMSRFEKYEDKYKHYSKRQLVENVDELKDILDECDKAANFTYLSCFKSLCPDDEPKRVKLLNNGLNLLYRLLTPLYSYNDKKLPEIKIGVFVDVAERLNMLNDFLTAASKYGAFAEESLHAFYRRLRDGMEMYYVIEFDKINKNINRIKDGKSAEKDYCEQLLLDAACATASALSTYIPFETVIKDRERQRLAKLCKQSCETFLLLRDYKLQELEQSNKYRPILDIYNAVMNESEE